MAKEYKFLSKKFLIGKNNINYLMTKYSFSFCLTIKPTKILEIDFGRFYLKIFEDKDEK
jgi:hypothetical protein